MPERVPVIDIAPFRNGHSDGKDMVARQFDQACTDVGFLVIVGHGIDADLPEAVFERARRFFDLPFAEKLKVRKEEGASGAGYHPLLTQANDLSHGPDGPEDIRESFGLGRPDRRAGSFNRWPIDPPELKEVCLRYYGEMEQLGARITRIFACALDLPEDYFADKIDRHDSTMLLHHYPQQKTPPLPNQLRSGAHTDLGLFTMLRTERQHRPGGLQVKTRSGDWIDVPPIPDSFIMNIGDTLMRWTNDHWLSNYHRVVNPPLGAGEESRRISMPFFFAANDDATIACLPSCCNAANPPRYAPVNAGDFRRAALQQGYDFAKRKAEARRA